jgi:hypothetical protein
VPTIFSSRDIAYRKEVDPNDFMDVRDNVPMCYEEYNVCYETDFYWISYCLTNI